MTAAPACGTELHRLPLLILYLSERCNSRCVTCDYWRHGRVDMTFEATVRLLPSLRKLETQVVLLSGGEPLLNPDWERIARLLRDHELKLWLLTSGLSLAKHARRAAQLFDATTVSLDATDRETYAAIRGVDAFNKVCQGIQAMAETSALVSVRVTLQRANFRQLPRFIDLARQLGAWQISFLAVDVGNDHAFGRSGPFNSELALRPDELAELEQLMRSLEREHAADFQSGFIAESPLKLRRIHQYFAALCGAAEFPEVRCNAPEFSAVITAQGHINPCYFIAGLQDSALPEDVDTALNGPRLLAVRDAIRTGARPECARCVCSMWREPGARTVADFWRSRASSHIN
ncbi:radical SAM protein [Steroidobacter cummioxidans]|uniref:radical SAM protein n=1 Tax=Steroidobacter cummioxidans TaxID=1803913 RepID=UPI00137981F4|nr:radical SAM protein [Steroidobacter cummioxidans]